MTIEFNCTGGLMHMDLVWCARPPNSQVLASDGPGPVLYRIGPVRPRPGELKLF
jgi:hypothetical protein